MRFDLAEGARNLLVECGGLRAGDRVLIVHEPAGLGYYDDAIVAALAGTARALGLNVQLREVPFAETAAPPDPELSHAMAGVDATVFLARLGDQLRFRDMPGNPRAIVCYALDAAMLGSAFGQVDHAGMVALKSLLDTALARATKVHVTCPAGTDFRGTLGRDAPAPSDTRTVRFPLSVHSPVRVGRFAGRIAQRGFLVGTGSQYYQPYACALREVLLVEFEGNRLSGFAGNADDVATARAHYAQVANRFGIDETFVHSWHAGIHPGCGYTDPANASFERWSGGAFGNPRLMHFHTCGAYAPGEISLNILDPTIRIDGVAVWENGRLFPDRLPGGARILAQHDDLRAAFTAPAQACGLGANGQLAFA